jgi:hypothetical protein
MDDYFLRFSKHYDRSTFDLFLFTATLYVSFEIFHNILLEVLQNIKIYNNLTLVHSKIAKKL